MRKINFLLSAVLITAAHLVPAQLSVVGSQNYGRMFDLTYDQKTANTIYAITMKNHIVVSQDNGVTWTLFYALPATMGTALTNLKLSADGTELRFSIDGPTAAVAVLNIAQHQITKVFAMPNAADNPNVTSYSFFPGNRNILLANTVWQVGFENFGKTFYTQDGGSTWKEVYDTELKDKVFLNAVAIDPVSSSKIYLLRGNGSMDVTGGLLISEDAGTTFREELGGITLNAIAFQPNNANTLYIGTGITYSGTPEALYYSNDGASTFSTAPVSWNNTGNTNHITHIAINPLNSYVYVLEEDEVAISKDNGATWTKKEYEIDNLTDYYYGLNMSFNPFNADELVLAQNFTPALSKDAGENFQLIKSPFFNSDVRLDMNESGAAKHLYYGVQYGFVHKNLSTGTENTGDIKALTAYGNFGAARIFADPKTEGRIFKFTGTSNGGVLRLSTDHGLTFKTIVSNDANQILDLKFDPSSPNVIWASFAQYGTPDLNKIDISDTDNIIVTPINLPSTEAVTQILHPGSSSAEFLVSAGAALYRTTDEGATYTEVAITNGALSAVFDIAQNPFHADELALATNDGIFISTDSGQTWLQTSAAEARMVQFSDTSDGRMIAANYLSDGSTFALFHSSNHGNSWTKVDAAALEHVESPSVYADFSGNSAKIYIATFDLGIVTYDLNFTTLSTGNSVKSEVTVYPNPTSDRVYINSAIQSASLYDYSGRQVAHTTVSEMNISHLNSGIYILKIHTADQKIITRKVIKK